MRRSLEFLVLLTFAGALVVASQSLAQTPSAGGTVPVAQLDNPKDLVSIGVVVAGGTPIGTVVNVKTDSDGKATRVIVALTTGDGAGRVAPIRAERLQFDRAGRVIVADLSPAQLTQLAQTATASAGGIDTSGSSGMVQRRMPAGADAAPPMAH